jgi:hypothetical protein
LTIIWANIMSNCMPLIDLSMSMSLAVIAPGMVIPAMSPEAGLSHFVSQPCRVEAAAALSLLICAARVFRSALPAFFSASLAMSATILWSGIIIWANATSASLKPADAGFEAFMPAMSPAAGVSLAPVAVSEPQAVRVAAARTVTVAMAMRRPRRAVSMIERCPSGWMTGSE